VPWRVGCRKEIGRVNSSIERRRKNEKEQTEHGSTSWRKRPCGKQLVRGGDETSEKRRIGRTWPTEGLRGRIEETKIPPEEHIWVTSGGKPKGDAKKFVKVSAGCSEIEKKT